MSVPSSEEEFKQKRRVPREIEKYIYERAWMIWIQATVKKRLLWMIQRLCVSSYLIFLSGHPEIEVIGTARNGKDAIEKVRTLKPDVVTMDIEMPLMNGLEALKEIMSNHPVPVVMLSSTTKIGAENTMLAMEYGAVDFVAKPGGAISLNLHEVKEEIVEKSHCRFGSTNVYVD